MHNPVATISLTLPIAAISLLVICLPFSNSTELINGIHTAKSFNIHNMAPGKFYPLYLLAKLYDASEQQHKAIAMANTILNKEIKVNSKAIEEIRSEMQQIIETYKERETTMNNTHLANEHQFW
jgi:hypothetical protein